MKGRSSACSSRARVAPSYGASPGFTREPQALRGGERQNLHAIALGHRSLSQVSVAYSCWIRSTAKNDIWTPSSPTGSHGGLGGGTEDQEDLMVLSRITIEAQTTKCRN